MGRILVKDVDAGADDLAPESKVGQSLAECFGVFRNYSSVGLFTKVTMKSRSTIMMADPNLVDDTDLQILQLWIRRRRCLLSHDMLLSYESRKRLKLVDAADAREASCL